jgi:hypothetical protein
MEMEMGNVQDGHAIDYGFLCGEVTAALCVHYHDPDVEAAWVLYSAVAAHFLTGPPVWLMVVAPPGSMKTELMQALDGVAGVSLIDRLTPNTLLSGQIEDDKAHKPGRKSPSLLHRLGERPIIICPDFTTVLSMKAEPRGIILADLRRIYDGRIRSEYGTAGNLAEREWRGRLTFLAATTPDVDRYYSMFQTMGERFLMVRWHRAGGIDAAVEAMNQNREVAKRDLKEAVNQLFKHLGTYEPTVPAEMQRMIGALSEFTVRARTYVHRTGNKEVTDQPQPESPTRLAQQLVQLAKGSALLAGRSEATEEDYQLVKRAAFDSIPAIRRKVIDALMSKRQKHSDFGLAKSTLSYVVEELEMLGIVANRKLSPEALNLLREAHVRYEGGTVGLPVHELSPLAWDASAVKS